MEVRSYRAVFDIERRIYRVDRLRLNPGGVPVRSFVYLFALALLSIVLASLPLLGALVCIVPWYLRELALPGAASALLTVLRIDGRPSHRFAASLIRDLRLPRQLDGAGNARRSDEVWRPASIVLLPDGSEPRMRRLRFSGPGVAVIYAPHRRCETWRAASPLLRVADVSVTQLPGRRLSAPQAVALGARARLEVG